MLLVVILFTYNDNMICPNDNSEMQQVKVVSHYNLPIILEQCKNCGGIWFDESELFNAKPGEAEKIELLNTDKLNAHTEIHNAVLRCPIDHNELFRFNDQYFPRGIILERCHYCKGIWLNRGHFVKFQDTRQQLQQVKENRSEDKQIKDDIKRILTENQAENSSAMLINLGNFLSMPIDRDTLQPSADSNEQTAKESNISSILYILMSILRFFILK
jgi:Zn-finger nucleic acid-binding protein